MLFSWCYCYFLAYIIVAFVFATIFKYSIATLKNEISKLANSNLSLFSHCVLIDQNLSVSVVFALKHGCFSLFLEFSSA